MDAGQTMTKELMKIFALAIMMFPLFATPFLIKLSGSVISRIAGFVNNPNKGPLDKLRKANDERANTVRVNSGRRALDKWNSNTYDPTTATRGQRAAHRARSLFKPGSVRDADRQAMLSAAQRNLKSSTESYVAEQAAHDQGYQASLAGLTEHEAAAVRRDPTSNPAAARYLQRAQATATAQEAKAATERVAAFTAQYEGAGQRGADPSDPYLASEYVNALRTNDADRAVAVINRLASLGAGGKAAARSLLTTHAVTDQTVRDRVQKAVMQDNYSTFLGTHGDIVKSSGFDASGQWQINGVDNNGNPVYAINKLTSEQLATQDQGTIDMYYNDISQAEAARIVGDVNLSAKVTNSYVLQMLDARSRGAQKPTPPPPSDIRLKRNIRATGHKVGRFGLPEYEYNYLWSDITYIGVMAQDVLKVVPDAVCVVDGFYHVYYDKLGTTLRVK